MRSPAYGMKAKRKTASLKHIIQCGNQSDLNHANHSDLARSKSLPDKSKPVKVYEFFSSIGTAISFSLSFDQSAQSKQMLHFTSLTSLSYRLNSFHLIAEYARDSQLCLRFLFHLLQHFNARLGDFLFDWIECNESVH
jgi:hypothetical protein